MLNRNPLGSLSSLTLALLISFSLLTGFGFKACSQSEKERNIAFARDLVSSFEAATPIVRRKSEVLARGLERATQSGRDLIIAFQESNETEITRLIQSILPAFTAVVNGFSDNENVLIALALGQIALSFFVNHFLSSEQGDAMKRGAKRGATVPVRGESIITAFKALPQFGCKYKPERCK